MNKKFLFSLFCFAFFGIGFAEYQRTHKPVQSMVQSGPGSFSSSSKKTATDASGNQTTQWTTTLDSNGQTHTVDWTATYDPATESATLSNSNSSGQWTITPDPSRYRRTVTSPNQRSVQTSYDPSTGAVTYTTGGVPMTASISGDTATMIGARGYSVSGVYDQAAGTVTVTGPQGKSVQGTVQAGSSPQTGTVTYTNSQGDQLVVTYNGDGTSSYVIIGPSGKTIQGGTGVYDSTTGTYTYTPVQRQVTYGEGSNPTVQGTLSVSGDVYTLTGAYGHSIAGTYNPNANTVTLTGPRGEQITGTYDPSTQTVTYNDPLQSGTQIVVSYSGLGTGSPTASYTLVNPYYTQHLGNASYNPNTGTYEATSSAGYTMDYTTNSGQTLASKTYYPTADTTVYTGAQGNHIVEFFDPNTMTTTYTYVNSTGQPQGTLTQTYPIVPTDQGSYAEEIQNTGPQGNTITETSYRSWKWD